jgi:hypothetical protein
MVIYIALFGSCTNLEPLIWLLYHESFLIPSFNVVLLEEGS